MAISLLEQSVLIKLRSHTWTNSTNAVALHQLKIRHFGLEKKMNALMQLGSQIH